MFDSYTHTLLWMRFQSVLILLNPFPSLLPCNAERTDCSKPSTPKRKFIMQSCEEYVKRPASWRSHVNASEEPRVEFIFKLHQSKHGAVRQSCCCSRGPSIHRKWWERREDSFEWQSRLSQRASTSGWAGGTVRLKDSSSMEKSEAMGDGEGLRISTSALAKMVEVSATGDIQASIAGAVRARSKAMNTVVVFHQLVAFSESPITSGTKARSLWTRSGNSDVVNGGRRSNLHAAPFRDLDFNLVDLGTVTCQAPRASEALVAGLAFVIDHTRKCGRSSGKRILSSGSWEVGLQALLQVGLRQASDSSERSVGGGAEEIQEEDMRLEFGQEEESEKPSGGLYMSSSLATSAEGSDVKKGSFMIEQDWEPVSRGDC
ncbi:hypothetical protein KCU90_g96, partial [Aureobasidium melanogenum]